MILKREREPNMERNHKTFRCENYNCGNVMTIHEIDSINETQILCPLCGATAYSDQ